MKPKIIVCFGQEALLALICLEPFSKLEFKNSKGKAAVLPGKPDETNFHNNPSGRIHFIVKPIISHRVQIAGEETHCFFSCHPSNTNMTFAPKDGRDNPYISYGSDYQDRFRAYMLPVLNEIAALPNLGK